MSDFGPLLTGEPVFSAKIEILRLRSTFSFSPAVENVQCWIVQRTTEKASTKPEKGGLFFNIVFYDCYYVNSYDFSANGDSL